MVPGLGLSSIWRLIDRFRSPAAVFAASRADLLRVRGIRESQISAILGKNETRARAEQELDRLASAGAAAITFEDAAYPEQLRQLPDPPPVLYVRGRIELLGKSSIAVVGSRAATAYGRRTAHALAGDLAHASMTVISGLALGIDAEAHAGALSGRGSTIAVLGCGLDVVYPKQNTRLFQRIAEQGLLVSEYPLGTPPEGYRFPARNRIIAGMALGVVVVEAAKRSGSLITAQIALDAGREVFAVPGQVDSCKSEGSHWLLKQGAKLVQDSRDVLEELGLDTTPGDSGRAATTGKRHQDLDPEAQHLLSCLDSYPLLRESLLQTAGLSSARLAELLLVLELEGLVEILPGDTVRKCVQ